MNHTGENSSFYAIGNVAHHCYEARNKEGLWMILQQERSRREQIAFFGRYTESFEALRLGLEFFTKQSGRGIDDDPRLCWLSLRASDLAAQSRGNMNQSMEQFKSRGLYDPERVQETIGQWTSMDDSSFAAMCICLIVVESGLWEPIPVPERSTENLMEMVAALFVRMRLANIDWAELLDVRFVLWVWKLICRVFPNHVSSLRTAFLRRMVQIYLQTQSVNEEKAVIRETSRQLMEHGELELAEETAQLMESSSERDPLLNEIIEASIGRNDLKKVDHLIESLNSPSDVGKPLFLVADYYFNRDQFHKAMDYAARIPPSSPFSAQANAMLARIQVQWNQKSKAKRTYRTAIEQAIKYSGDRQNGDLLPAFMMILKETIEINGEGVIDFAIEIVKKEMRGTCAKPIPIWDCKDAQRNLPTP